MTDKMAFRWIILILMLKQHIRGGRNKNPKCFGQKLQKQRDRQMLQSTQGTPKWWTRLFTLSCAVNGVHTTSWGGHAR